MPVLRRAFPRTAATRESPFVLDLTDRKRAEEAVRESEEQWKAVFENNPTMYFMVDFGSAIFREPLRRRTAGIQRGRVDWPPGADPVSPRRPRLCAKEGRRLPRTPRQDVQLGGAQNPQGRQDAVGSRDGQSYVCQEPTRRPGGLARTSPKANAPKRRCAKCRRNSRTRTASRRSGS